MSHVRMAGLEMLARFLLRFTECLIADLWVACTTFQAAYSENFQSSFTCSGCTERQKVEHSSMDYLHTEINNCESEWSQMSDEGYCQANPQGPLVTLHLLANPGCGTEIRGMTRMVLQAVVPSSPALVWVSERELHRELPPMEAVPTGLVPQPALAVVLFLREEEEEGLGENRALRLLRAQLSRPPWQYHHTEGLDPRRQRILPYEPAGQDFYSLGGARDLPLWAVRQVHYGQEMVRYTLYCRHASFPLATTLYTSILGQEPAIEREGFVCFALFRPHSLCEVQLALKRLPPKSHPSRLPSALLEFRVTDLQPLRPHLPHPCTPISALRWQTRDHDGNKILLQVREVSAVECWSGCVSLHSSLCSSSPGSLSEASRSHTCFHEYRTCRCQKERATGSLRDSSSSLEGLYGGSFSYSSSLSSSPLSSPSSSSVSRHLESNCHPCPPCSYKAAPQSSCLPQGQQKQTSPCLLKGHSAFRRVLPSATSFQPIEQQKATSLCLSPGYHSDEFYI